MQNGMVINENRENAAAENKKIAEKGALLALGKKQGDDLQDNRSVSEYFAELFSYAPAILSDAMTYSD